jgi:hypothetical protein
MQRAVIEGIDPALDRLGVLVDEQFHAALPGHLVTQFVHLPELPGGVDVQQRERWRRGMERLARQVKHHRAVLADRIHHHRPLGLRDDFAHDVDRLGFEPFQMGQGLRHRLFHSSVELALSDGR